MKIFVNYLMFHRYMIVTCPNNDNDPQTLRSYRVFTDSSETRITTGMVTVLVSHDVKCKRSVFNAIWHGKFTRAIEETFISNYCKSSWLNNDSIVGLKCTHQQSFLLIRKLKTRYKSLMTICGVFPEVNFIELSNKGHMICVCFLFLVLRYYISLHSFIHHTT